MTTIVFDTETTGLLVASAASIEHQPHLVELHAIKLNNDLNYVDQILVRCKPPILIPDEAIKVHGITNQMVADEKPFAAVYPGIANFFLGSDTLVGHNLLFDKYVLWWELVRLGKQLNFPWSIRGICTAEVSSQYFGHRLNLQDLHIHLFGGGFADAHSAQVDCAMTAKCFTEMHKRKMV